MFKFNRSVLVSAATAMVIGLTACGTAPTTSNQASADCAKLENATTTATVWYMSLFTIKGNTYKQGSFKIDGIPEGATIWQLLRDNNGVCYMHSLPDNRPVGGSNFSLGTSVGKNDLPAGIDSPQLVLVVVTDNDLNKELEALTNDGMSGTFDKVVGGLDNRALKVQFTAVEMNLDY
jgi:hypothetical protein